MKIVPRWLSVLLLSVMCILTGCQTPKPGSSIESGPARATRNNCYSLLHQLLNDQKHVHLLLFIKREQADVNKLIHRIAAASAAGAKQLEELARQDPSILLDDIGLPPGELATREAIASTKKKELLGQSGGEFELSLLLTQLQALSYASHLAQVAGANESQPDRAQAMAGLSGEMKNLYQEVFVLLRSRIK